MEAIHKQVGRNLATLRKGRGLSLDQVAVLTGVSKGMLAQIERGDSNPTITVLWKIVNGLKVSFTSLIAKEMNEVELVTRADIEPLIDERGYTSFPMFPFDEDKGFEIYAVEMEPGSNHGSDAHNSGITEYVIPVRGSVSVTIGEQVHLAGEGQVLRFAADLPHSYDNPGKDVNQYYVLIHYPK